MKNALLFSLVSVICLYSLNSKAAEYDVCLNSARNDYDIAACNVDEATRLLRTANSKLATLAANPYFKNWDNPKQSTSQNFKDFLDKWVLFRDQYCSLIGYTYSQGQGSISRISETKCSVDMTKRLVSDIDQVVSSYNENGY